MHYRAFRLTFEAEGRPFPIEEYKRFAVGASREQVIREVMGELPEARFRHLMSEKERHVREYLDRQAIEVIPGALDFVRAVRSRGARTAVATASRTPDIILRSARAIDLFDAIVGRDSVARSKPHPDLYLHAAQVLGCPPRECIVIEDSPVGVEAALSAGMRCIALTTTESRERLSRATAVYDGFHEIRAEHWIQSVEREPA
jgi:HAD superfamily hydrolase (TIGR01509 family)